MLTTLLLFCCIRVTYTQTPKRWGSSVITETSGPSPLMRYLTPDDPYVKLDKQFVQIENETCFLSGQEIGKPCKITNTLNGFLTEIKLFSVNNYKRMIVSGLIWHTTFFAPNCKFSKALPGDIIPEASLPLFRFMRGYTEVNITFATSFVQEDVMIELWDTDNIICEWEGADLYNGDKDFCQLELRNGKTELWFNGIFHKRDRNNNTYQWASGSGNYLSVSVDWTRTGLAPEDVVCFPHLDFECRKSKTDNFWINAYVMV
uniref:DUF5727 domain-containing protein n=1 Tax=Schistocephalus solidus TaxID=70667 RepID=A0A0X3Q1W7_SCHSO